MEIFSPEFQPGDPIPRKYTCDGTDISIPLGWKKVPEGTKSLAVIMDDPDAPMGTWVHWVIYNIPATAKGLQENQPHSEMLKDGSMQGINTGKQTGYSGPCPPGGVHRYFFKLYALDMMLPVKAGLTKEGLLEAMQSHIIEETQIFGTYQRNR